MMPILMISFLSGLPLSLLNVFFHPFIYFIIIPVIYWCFHKQLGFRLLFIMAFSIYVNILIFLFILLVHRFCLISNFPVCLSPFKAP